jgi:tetratricopeptide (TPR) repeat protein
MAQPGSDRTEKASTEKTTGRQWFAMRRLPAALLPTGIFLVTCAAFWPALQGEFSWDDDTNLVTNLRYRGFGGSQIKWMFTNTLMGHYMPFTWLTFALDHVLGRMDPWGYHLVSLLLHAANAILVYLVARRLLTVALQTTVDTRAGAAVAGLLFALHPQRVESVAWISDRATILCGTFYLVAVLAYLRAVGAPHGRRRMWLGAVSLVAFAAALLSKGMAMSLPITLLILDVYPLRRWRTAWPRVLLEKLPYGALAIAGAVVAAWARSQGAEFTGYAHYGFAARLGMIAYSFYFYPLKLVWPADLSPLYEMPSRVSLLDPRFLTAILVLLAVTSILLALRRRAPAALAAWTHSAAVVAPVSGVVHSGLQMVADRYSYLAQLGFVVLAGYGLVRLLELHRKGRVRRAAAIVAGSGIVLTIGALAVLTWSQSYVWRDPETLWRWAVDLDPLCARCHNNLGVALLHRRRDPQGLSESEEHLRRAVALRPEDALGHLNLGIALIEGGRPGEAIVELEHALRVKPDSVPTLISLGRALLADGRADPARAAFERAIAINAADPVAHLGLARAHLAQGDRAAAREQIPILERLDPQRARMLEQEIQ